MMNSISQFFKVYRYRSTKFRFKEIIMNKLLSGITVSFLLGLTSPAFAQDRPSLQQPTTPSSAQTTKNDFVCNYQYKVGDETKEASVSGTTRLAAKEQRSQQIERLEEEADQRGENFEVTYQLCRDPFGPN
jgi:hypothetical protein